jgi:hypothetical protein
MYSQKNVKNVYTSITEGSMQSRKYLSTLSTSTLATYSCTGRIYKSSLATPIIRTIKHDGERKMLSHIWTTTPFPHVCVNLGAITLYIVFSPSAVR